MTVKDFLDEIGSDFSKRMTIAGEINGSPTEFFIGLVKEERERIVLGTHIKLVAK